jgi:hypothetical protein
MTGFCIHYSKDKTLGSAYNTVYTDDWVVHINPVHPDLLPCADATLPHPPFPHPLAMTVLDAGPLPESCHVAIKALGPMK